MFLSSLNDEQKKAFLAIALKIVGSDRHLDPRERKTIEAMRFEMGLWNETSLPKGIIEELAKPFDTRQSQVTVMLEAIGLAYVDEDYAESEKKILRALAQFFEFTEEEANKMEDWVIRYKELQKEAVAMFEN